jgi:hypothetical protein
VRDDDWIAITIDPHMLTGRIDLIGERGQAERLTPQAGADLLAQREPDPRLGPDANLPDDTRLWAALQEISGGPWAGAVYDVDRILAVIAAGKQALGL